MHMADALISPTVGGGMWIVSSGLVAYCSKRIRDGIDDTLVPLMGVLGAFVFAAQMINFTIPGTGSSGHLTGGLLLAVLLGPHAAFLVMASILTVQALLFADGGLLALGCNIFNMSFPACFIAYPFIYRPLMQTSNPSNLRLITVSVLAAVVSLQIGAFGVVLETLLSGISELPFMSFVMFMQPIHLAIGVVEGVVTAGVMGFLYRYRPELFGSSPYTPKSNSLGIRGVLAVFGVLAFLIAGVFSWFASSAPDGLEWSIGRVTGKEGLKVAQDGVHDLFASIQSKLAVLPDYSMPEPETGLNETKGEDKKDALEEDRVGKGDAWPVMSAGTSLAGILGGIITLLLVSMVGFILKKGMPQSA